MTLDGECPTCDGHGSAKLRRRRKGDPQRIAPCRRCQGTGRIGPPAWMVPGAACWYAPHMDSPKRYAGYIAGPPRRLGDPETGALVVNLRDMELAYRDGVRSTVPAAAIWCVMERLAGPRRAAESSPASAVECSGSRSEVTMINHLDALLIDAATMLRDDCECPTVAEAVERARNVVASIMADAERGWAGHYSDAVNVALADVGAFNLREQRREEAEEAG